MLDNSKLLEATFSTVSRFLLRYHFPCCVAINFSAQIGRVVLIEEPEDGKNVTPGYFLSLS
jgi:hypothetical protein